MPLESRSRMISFRLTDEEYDCFRRVCISRGLRNVSELVRAAVKQLVGDAGLDQPVTPLEMHVRVANLEAGLADLASAVAHMESRLAVNHSNSRNPVQFVQSASGQ